MPSDVLASALVTAVNLVTTYLLHSTLLLGTAALAACCRRPRSHALSARLWKAAALVPLVTAPLQLTWGFGNPVFSSSWTPRETEETVRRDRAEVEENTRTAPLPPENERPAADAPPDAPTDVDVASLEQPSPVPPAVPPVQPLPRQESDVTESTATPLPSEHVADTSQPPSIAPTPESAPTDEEPHARVAASHPPIPGFAIWTAGIVAFIAAAGSLRVLITGRRFRRRVREFSVVEAGPLRAALTRLLRQTSLTRPVRLLVSDDLNEPVAFGLRRPAIAVPRGIENRLDRHELEAVLAHELAHLVRGDAWWQLFGRILCGCLPYQPLNFLARSRWRQAAEFQCDDWAAERTGNPVMLARCLTTIAGWRHDASSCVHVLPVGGSQSTLSRRVERLLDERRAADPWKRSHRRRLLTLAMLLTGASLCGYGPRATLLAYADNQPAQSPSADAEPEKPHSAALEGELAALNAELLQLEANLRKVQKLIRETAAPIEAKQLAKRFSTRLAALRRTRRELLARADIRNTND